MHPTSSKRGDSKSLSVAAHSIVNQLYPNTVAIALSEFL